MMCATLLDPNQPNHYLTASPVRAREHQIRAPEKGILGGMSTGSYPDNVTVYPYNGYIRGTNPVTRHVMSLTRTLKRICANQHASKHAATRPLHDSNARARAPNLVAYAIPPPPAYSLPYGRPLYQQLRAGQAQQHQQPHDWRTIMALPQRQKRAGAGVGA